MVRLLLYSHRDLTVAIAFAFCLLYYSGVSFGSNAKQSLVDPHRRCSFAFEKDSFLI